MVSFPYYSHTTPIRIPKDMGMVWESYHKGVPLLGVPEITLDKWEVDQSYLKWVVFSKYILFIVLESNRWGSDPI